MKKIHTRNPKTHFKGVVQKMLISSLVLTSVLGSTTGAFAAEAPKVTLGDVKVVAYENGVSVETALRELKTTIAKIKIQVEMGNVQKSFLEKLASQLNQLERSANGESSGQIVALLNSVEDAVKGVSGNESVLVALQQVRDSLGIGSIEDVVQAPKANSGSGVVFSDVSESDWFFDSVTAMSKSGFLQGTGNDEFAPSATMTRAAYITIAVRIAYPDELNARNNENPNQDNWWDNAWTVAHEKGLIKNTDPNMGIEKEDMDGTISREEMALILARTAHTKGVATSDLVFATQIPDFKDVGGYYRDSVRECYTLGLLNGVDQQGTFSPQGTLDRASASQSFFKLLNADKRTPVTPQAPSFTQVGDYKPASTLQTWTEGEVHTIPQEGDTVIKADGTKVVLKKNQVGNSTLYLLGWGQGVDIITGTKLSPTGNYTSKVGDSAWGGWCDDLSRFIKSEITGEVYTEGQWKQINVALYPEVNGTKGTYDGEISANGWYKWDSFLQMWGFYYAPAK